MAEPYGHRLNAAIRATYAVLDLDPPDLPEMGEPVAAALDKMAVALERITSLAAAHHAEHDAVTRYALVEMTTADRVQLRKQWLDLITAHDAVDDAAAADPLPNDA